MKDDTIAAIATPLGAGGLAVIRISGPDALAVADGVFAAANPLGQRPSEVPSHRVLYGRAMRGGERLDEVLLTVLRAPRTFTREDVVEISCHGGVLVTRSILEAVLAQGARLAEPGEFTRRAFLNGRIDLTQAEAVADLIQARTDLARVAATEQLAGHLSRHIETVRSDLVSIQAHVEAHLDFPEEDIAPETREQLERRLVAAVAAIDRLLSTAREGEILRHGLRVAIVGRPNAGKSSLLNQLLGLDRAIVSALPGTTRDTIEATANVRGLPVILVDTAGLREAGDQIEEEGVRRSRSAIERADLILYVVDASEPWDGADQENLTALAAQRPLVVLNKVDLPRRAIGAGPAVGDTVEVSARTGAGIEALRDAIKGRVWRGEVGVEMLQVMINARHADALRRAREALQRAAEGLRDGAALDGVALETRLGVLAVGEVVGRTTTEDLLDRIFSTFCIGK